MSRCVVILFAYVTIAFAVASPGQTNAAQGVIKGTVAYRTRVALPLDATIAVRLEDVSSGTQAQLLGESVVSAAGHEAPVAFELSYDRAAVNPSHVYQVRATITANGKLLFTSTKNYRVIPNGAPTTVAIVLQEDITAAGPSALTVEEVQWKFFMVGGQSAMGGRATPWIVLHKDHNKFTCWTGCNRMFGTYLLIQERLEFTPVGTTALVCTPEITSHEKAVASAIQATRRYRIQGNNLELLLGDEVLGTLRAENPE